MLELDRLPIHLQKAGAMMHISTSVGYLVAIIVGLIISGFARLYPGRIVRLGAIFNLGLSREVTRFAFVFIWWWIGWHFLGSLKPI
jgi:TM2 domain-containing membrane protein YozV